MLNPSHFTPLGNISTFQAWKQAQRGQALGYSHSQAAPKPRLASVLLIVTSALFQGPEQLPCAVRPSWQTRRGEAKMK